MRRRISSQCGPVTFGDGRVGDVDQGPVVPAGALGAGSGREPLPGPGGQPMRQVDRRAGPGWRGDRVGLGHGQDVAQPAARQPGAQLGVLAVHFVGSRPGCGRPGVQGPADHLPGQRGLGRERDVRRDPGGGAPGRIIRPGPRQVQGPVQERRPQPARHRPGTPRPGRSPSARRCRCTAAECPPSSCPS